ncbi:MAG: TonB-dependent receptor [Gammaproteobacteria bacterium]
MHPNDKILSARLRQAVARALTLSSMGTLSLLGAGSVVAQETSSGAGELEHVVVTGTRIRGIAPTGSPVVALGRDTIEDMPGPQTTGEILSTLPQVFNLGANDRNYGAANNQSANVTLGTGINLRGLGTESTLTLLNGRRLPMAGTQAQFFDPSIIPTSAIDRMEVLADGGSGIYGSDAVGGVVNIMLREGYDGAQFSAQYGSASGLDQRRFGGAFGTVWGSGSFMIAGEYNDRDNLPASKRSFYTDDLRPWGGPDQRVTFASPGNIVVDGVSYAIPAGQDGTSLTADDLVAGTQNRVSRYLGADALPNQERYSFATTFQQDLTDSISLSVQGLYAHREGANRGTAPSATLTVPSTNPFFVHPTDPNAESVTVQYSFINEVGPSTRRGEQEVYFITAGLTFDLDSGWSVQTFASQGVDKERSGLNNIAGPALNQALADPNPATAFNPFGDGSANNPATIAAIQGEFRVDTNYEMNEFGVIADGPLFDLPGGTVSAAIGASRVEIDFINYNPTPSSPSRSFNSFFGELFFPLVGAGNSVSGVEQLNFSLALRHDDYNDVGSTTNPQLGLTWVVNDSLSFRTSYGKSFRAPTLSDIGDPFDVIADFVDPTSPTGTSRVIFRRGGQPGVKPEKATTWSFGIDVTPVNIPALEVALTYFNVDYENRIANPGNNPLALTQEDIYAPVILRNPPADLVLSIMNGRGFNGVPEDPSNIVAIVDGRRANLGAVKTDGLEMQVSYGWGDGAVSYRVGGNIAYILSFDQAITPTAPVVDIVDTINNPLALKGRAYFGASVKDFSATLFLNHVGGYTNDSVTPHQGVGSYSVFDLSMRYKLRDAVPAMTLSLDAQNLFDRDPPYVNNGTLAFDSNVANPLGRMLTLGIRMDF